MLRFAGAISAVALFLGAASAGNAAEFSSAVEQVLMKQKEITDLDAGRRAQMIACVKQSLQAVPAGKQRYVEEAANYDEIESRFGEVVLADNAKFKQKITKDCGEIAVSDD